MYICISTLKEIGPGEVLFLEKDWEFGEIAAKEIGGKIIGFVMHSQPSGCARYDSAVRNIGGKRIVAQVALVSGDVAVLSSESTVLLPTTDLGRQGLRTVIA